MRERWYCLKRSSGKVLRPGSFETETKYFRDRFPDFFGTKFFRSWFRYHQKIPGTGTSHSVDQLSELKQKQKQRKELSQQLETCASPQAASPNQSWRPPRRWCGWSPGPRPTKIGKLQIIAFYGIGRYNLWLFFVVVNIWIFSYLKYDTSKHLHQKIFKYLLCKQKSKSVAIFKVIQSCFWHQSPWLIPGGILIIIWIKWFFFFGWKKMILVPEKATEDSTDIVHNSVDPNLKKY